MVHVSLFSGIAGFTLACDENDIETILHCEIDSFCQKVLRKHYPDVPIVKDVNDVEEIKRIVADAEFTNGTELRGYPQQPKAHPKPSDDALLLTAGFPCQPFSAAGRRRGKSDDRYLWPQTMAVISAVRPDWVLLENVAGLLSMVFPDSETRVASQASFCEVPNDQIADYDTISGGIDRDLRQAGYETVWFVIPACGLGAPHRRDRVWIVANSQRSRCHGQKVHLPIGQSRQAVPMPTWTDSSDGIVAHDGFVQHQGAIEASSREDGWRAAELGTQDSHAADASGQRPQEREMRPGDLRQERQASIGGAWQENWYEVATRFCRVDDGLPRVVDRVDRLKALGNAIVPQVASEIVRAIKEGA